jgi:hypothetical protein
MPAAQVAAPHAAARLGALAVQGSQVVATSISISTSLPWKASSRLISRS